MNQEQSKKVREQTTGAAIEGDRVLGSGLPEPVFEQAPCREAERRGVAFTRQDAGALRYRGEERATALSLDLKVEEKTDPEPTSAGEILPVPETQALTHLRPGDMWRGIPTHFNDRLSRGVKRLVSAPARVSRLDSYAVARLN
ncbi:MAG: GxxExxY protein [Candidatus Hydrogenedentes bacterium]|nr:GxxExxY protein [Candidatus Hydrogenedentota bacterium]